MATLEKIRSRSVLLLVIIAVALLAFILGDFFTSGRTFFGTGTTIAKVDGQKIDVMDFQKRVEKAQQQAQQSGRNVDGAVLQKQVLDQMIEEKILEQEYKKLGITVTDQELTDMLVGKNSFYFDNMVRQRTGIESAAELHEMAFNPGKYDIEPQQAAQLKQIWLDLEHDAAQGMKGQKFQTLFMGTLPANKLDAKAMFEEGRTTAHIAYAKKDFSGMPDDKYEVTDADLNNEWTSRKGHYRLDEPTRVVEFISVAIEPSPADAAVARAAVNQAVTGLRTQPGTEGLNGLNGFVPNRQTLAAESVTDKPLKAWLDSANVGSAGIVTSRANKYTLAKLLNTSSEVDKVTIDFLAVQAPAAEIDSMVRQLNAGAVTFADLAANPAVAGSQDSTEVSLLNPQMLTLKETLLTAQTGVWFTPDSLPENGRIFRVRSKSAPVKVYEVATIEYAAEPSAATVNALESDLARYVNSHKTVQEFVDSAAAAGYNVRSAQITPSSAQLANLPDSRNLVAWAMDAKKGQVSGLFGDESTGRYTALAVEDIYSEYTPFTDKNVRTDLERRVRNRMKADELRGQYDGKAKDVAGYASAMGTSVDSTTVNFAQVFIPGIGPNESELAALTLTAKPGQLVGPVATQDGLVYLTVTSVEENPRPYNEDEAKSQFESQRASGAMMRKASSILRGNKKITNNTLKFYK